MSLNDKEFLRYNRHVMLQQVGEQGQLAFKKAHVLIVGLGGLGCPAAQYLCASGIGKLTLVDHDVVELSNLQRQILYCEKDVGQSKVRQAKVRLGQLNPHCQISAIEKSVFDLDLSQLLADVDIVLDCTDSAKTRRFINQHCFNSEVKMVSASSIQGAGQLVKIGRAHV